MTRKQAEIKYKMALNAERAAQDQPDESIWVAANDALTTARAELVEAEIAEPTKAEIKKRDRLLMLRNRGLDV